MSTPTTTTIDTVAGIPASVRGSGRLPIRLALRRSPGPVIAMIVIAIWVLSALLGPVFFGSAALEQNLVGRLRAPFQGGGILDILGTDSLGRSMLARLVVGAQTALAVSAFAVLISAVVGTALGLVSGYFGRTTVDIVLMRLADILMTAPSILLALTVMYVLHPGVAGLVLVLAITRMPIYMRLARARVLELREETFVEVARSLGGSRRRIIFSELPPLVIPTIGTVAMLEISTTLLNAAGLSFIGVGLQPPTVDWGLMVSEGQEYLTQAWWLSLLPGAAIMAVGFSASIISNWLRALADPSEMAGMLTSRRWKRTLAAMPSDNVAGRSAS